ncbi:hypothetical protein QYE76_000039 [Lolium multiflorum]|uniref:F-box domain-containing protein n=1 Tax=Lolium multiflorum TaxID=4521 RepID=A0AAD8VBZ9_LOLMU|nr:hypothetical protein QYE76_000039 [Lolium multiflorum]
MAPGSKKKKKKGVKGSPMDKLTDDILTDIISRVPYKSTCYCKCVSTRWRGLFWHPDHRARRQRRLGRGQRPRARRKKRKDNKGLDAVFFLPNTVYPHKQEYIQHQAGQDVSDTRDITWVVPALNHDTPSTGGRRQAEMIGAARTNHKMATKDSTVVAFFIFLLAATVGQVDVEDVEGAALEPPVLIIEGLGRRST